MLAPHIAEFFSEQSRSTFAFRSTWKNLHRLGGAFGIRAGWVLGRSGFRMRDEVTFLALLFRLEEVRTWTTTYDAVPRLVPKPSLNKKENRDILRSNQW